MATDDLKKIKHEIPFSSPVQPVELALDDEIQFHCHKDIACFNACCKSIDIQITPYDILRLKRHLGMSSSEFVARYTTPFAMDFHNMPGLKMNTKPGTSECVFLTAEGCSVYQDRPAACRYYALGSMGVRKKDSATVEDIFFMVKENHCLGHEEPRTLTVRQYREEQGCDEYDEHNRAWRDVILKKRSSGPTVGAPSERSLQLFDMCSYDMDSFCEFIQTDGFDEVFDLDGQTKKSLLENEELLLQFAFRFLKQVLFGEMSIPVKEDAKDKRMARRSESQARMNANSGGSAPESGTEG